MRRINKEQRITEIYASIDKYIKTYGTISGYMGSHDLFKKYIYLYNMNLKDICNELGYDWFQVGMNRNSYNFKSKEELKEHISKIIDVCGHFPTCIELSTYGIWARAYNKFYKSYSDLRQDMGYTDQFVDKLGYKCKSSYELMFANYLIDNQIKFDREEKPFCKENYRSDFTLYTLDHKKIYVEIWGLLKDNPMGQIETTYKEVYDIKMKLYNDNKLNLKSFYIKDFTTLNVLISKISKLVDIDKLIKIKNENYVHHCNDYTVEEIKNILESEFGCLNYFPSSGELRDRNLNNILKAIYKHYGSISTIAEKMNLLTKKKWCKENHINIHNMQPNTKFNIG